MDDKIFTVRFKDGDQWEEVFGIVRRKRRKFRRKTLQVLFPAI